MGLPRGTTIRLTPLRRLLGDMMAASQKVPQVSFERTMPLADVVSARRQADARPSWFAVFAKAYAAVSERRPELRRTFLTWPRERLHQHACNVAAVIVARKVGDEDAVLARLLRFPERASLAELDARIRAARSEPVERCADFRRQVRVSRLPRPVRRLAVWAGLNVSGDWRAKYFGTFAVTAVSGLGASSLGVLYPLTTTLSYGVFAPDGRVTVRIFSDHRVLDGAEPARALEELEAELRGPIRAELLAGAAAQKAA